MSTLRYRGYVGSVEVSVEDGLLHGRALGLRDMITFASETVEGLQREFEKSVDDYLAFCTELGKPPEKPLSGRLPFRTAPEHHRAIAAAAQQSGTSINAWMEKVLVEAATRQLHQ
jgi:predicted HicB family RNase H-like nuclease